MPWSGSVSVDGFAFQACSFNHSDISPFRINNLRSRIDRDHGDCDKSSNVPRSLTGFSSIAAPLLLPRRNDRGTSNPAKLKCWKLPRNRPVQRFAKTESRLSTTLDSPRNSFHVFDFSDSTIWLLLALTVLFWQVAGTIVGTVLRADIQRTCAPNPMIDDRSADSERVVEEVTHRR